MRLPFTGSSQRHPDLLELQAEYLLLRSGADERVQRMTTYRDENLAVRDSRNDLGVREITDYGRRARGQVDEAMKHRIPLPLGMANTVKHAYRIAGQLPDVVVDQRDESPQERHRSDTMEKIVWAIIRCSRGETAFASGAWDGSQLGATCFDLYMDVQYQIPRFRRVDPVGIFEVQGVDDPHDFQRVYRTWDAPLSSVRSMYRDQYFRGEPVDVNGLTASHQLGKTEMCRIVQLCDQNKVIRYASGGRDEQLVGLYEYEHGYGFTPYVVIPNIGPYEDVWGWADYEFVRSLVAYLPKLLSREADILRAVANGSYIERGTGQNPHDVKRTLNEGGVLPSKRDGEVEPIQAPDMPAFHETHSDRTMDLYKMLGFTPDAAWGLPGSGSGTDRGLQLQPLLEYTGMKQLNWAAGLSRLFSLAYRMIESKIAVNTTYRGAAYASKGARRDRFSLLIGPTAPPIETTIDDADGFPIPVELPRTPRELFDGDYEVRFTWRNRIDPDDPTYVASEVNKFTQGVQSLETTLENLGIQAPEDEMRRIEKEAERFPWINQGLVALLKQQLGGQGVGGGAPEDPAASMGGAIDTLTSGAAGAGSGALTGDAVTSAFGGTGPLYGQA